MKFGRFGLYILTLFLLPMGLSANEQIPKSQIRSLQVYNDFAVVRLMDPGQNVDGCTRSNAAEFVAVLFDSSAGREMYSAVLAAYMSGRELGFGASGCHAWGGSTVPRIYRVDFGDIP